MFAMNRKALMKATCVCTCLIGTPCLVVGLERLINLEAESVYDPHEISVDGELLQTQVRLGIILRPIGCIWRTSNHVDSHTPVSAVRNEQLLLRCAHSPA